MYYLDEAKHRLQTYNLKRCGVISLEDQIARLNELIKASAPLVETGEDPPESAGDLKRQDAVYNYMATAYELREKLTATKRQVESISAALNQIGEYDRMIIERMIVNREKADDLAAELFVTTRTVFRHQDRALRRFALAYYGIEA